MFRHLGSLAAFARQRSTIALDKKNRNRIETVDQMLVFPSFDTGDQS
jgi:hypothetical protein